MGSDLPKQNCECCGAGLPAESPAGWCARCALEQTLLSSTAPADSEALSLHDIPQLGEKVKYIGDYELLEVIAHGGMGVVYKARQKSLNRIVAVKLLLGGLHARNDFKKRLRKEAELAAQLNHPNIVAIHETGEFEGQPYFAMEYVAGPNLSELTRQQPLPPRKAAEYVKTVAEAISYAHQRGVLHRDLKPSNILIGTGDRPMITDFGLARQLDADSCLTGSGDTLGTPGYLPPEQASAKRGQIGVQSDVYSLGAVLYHLLTGRPPFMAGTLADTLRQVLESEPVALRQLNPAIPRDLQTICLKCLEKDVHRRYESMQTLVDELERFLKGEPILARPVGKLERMWKWRQRRPVTAGLSLAVMIAVTLGSIGFIWQRHRAEQHKVKIVDDTKIMAIMIAQMFASRGEDINPEQVKGAFEWLLQTRAKGNPNSDEAVIIRYCFIGTLLWKEFFAEAEPVARDFLSYCEKNGSGNKPEDVRDLALARIWLGTCLAKQMKYAEAEALLLSGCTTAEQQFHSELGTNNFGGGDLSEPFTLEYGFLALTQLYADTGRSHQAAEWQFKLAYIFERNRGRTNSIGEAVAFTNMWRTPACFALGTWLFEEFPDTRPGATVNTNVSKVLHYGGFWRYEAGAYTNLGLAFFAAPDETLWVSWVTNYLRLVMHPDNEHNAAAIAFTARRSGSYRLTGIFARGNTAVSAGDGVSVAIVRDRDTTNVLFKADIPSTAVSNRLDPFQEQEAADFDVKLSLGSGDVVRLLVFNGPPGSNDERYDATALTFNITLEASTNEPPLTLSSKSIFNELLGGNGNAEP